MGHLGGHSDDDCTGVMADSHTRLLHALPHLGTDGKTQCNHPASLLAFGPAKRFGDWRRGHLLHPHVLVHCSLGRGGHCQPPNRGQHGSGALHDSFVALHCLQFARELLDRRGPHSPCTSVFADRFELGLVAELVLGRTDGLATPNHSPALYPITRGRRAGRYLAAWVDVLPRGRCCAGVLRVHVALLRHHVFAAHHLYRIALGLGFSGWLRGGLWRRL